MPSTRRARSQSLPEMQVGRTVPFEGGADDMRIYKYPLQLTDLQVIDLPLNARLLSVEEQDNILMLWALVDEKAMTTMPVHIRVIVTGNPCDDIVDHKFLGTV